MDWIYWLLAFIGHLGLWCSIFNRIHATAYPRKVRKASEKLILALVGFPLLWVLALMMLRRTTAWEEFVMFPVTWIYLYGCVLLGVFLYRSLDLAKAHVAIASGRYRNQSPTDQRGGRIKATDLRRFDIAIAGYAAFQ